jgi:hypothetical protein
MSKPETKQIRFWAEPNSDSIKYIVDPPVPAKKEIPEWYLNLSRYHKGTELQVDDDGNVNLGVKACIPFYDAITAGYIVKLHCDVLIESVDEDGEVAFKWTSEINPAASRASGLFNNIPNTPGYGSFKFVWELFYPFLLPEGYSALVTQPLNRFDLPTFTSSGVLDADVVNGGGGIPFAIKEGFTGIIPAGTPIMQIIPFKRNDWEMEVLESKPKTKVKWNPKNKISSWYKLNVWQRKEWN